MPDAQTIWNGVLTIAVLVITGALTLLRDSLKNLQQADETLVNKVQAIELLVAGTYVKRDDLERKLDRIFDALKDIDVKLDSKVNRTECPVIHEAVQLHRKDPP